MTAPSSAPKYYVSSERVSARLALVFPLVGGALAVGLGLLYAFVSALITQVFEERLAYVVATPLFGGALALAGHAVCYLGQVRRASLRLPIMLAVGVLGYYFSWQFYLPMLDHQEIFSPGPTWLMSPPRVFHAMSQLAADQGLLLALSWLLEAAVVFGTIVLLQKNDESPPDPFCEACSQWTSVVFSLELSELEADNAATRLKQGEPEQVLKLKRRPAARNEWALVRIYRCPCRASRYVSVHRCRLERGKDASVKYGHYSAGAANHLMLDPGSPDETHYTPVLVNLVLDEAGEKALEKARP